MKTRHNEKEIWKDIPNFEDRYRVSNLGRVRSKDWIIIRGDGLPYTNRGQLLTQTKNTDGYPTVCMKKGDIKKTVTVHRIVGLLFVDNPNNNPLVLHKDGTKDNNIHFNLYWGTHSDNHYDAVRHGTHPRNRGENNGHSKLTREDVLMARRLLDTGKYTHQQIGNTLGVSTTLITMIRNRKRWGHI